MPLSCSEYYAIAFWNSDFPISASYALIILFIFLCFLMSFWFWLRHWVEVRVPMKRDISLKILTVLKCANKLPALEFTGQDIKVVAWKNHEFTYLFRLPHSLVQAFLRLLIWFWWVTIVICILVFQLLNHLIYILEWFNSLYIFWVSDIREEIVVKQFCALTGF